MRTQKTIVSALALSLTIGVAQAQTEAGKVLLNGRINYSQSTNESNTTGIVTNPNGPNSQKSKQSSFSFLPQIGFFVADNLAIGLSGSTSSTKQKQTQYYGGPNITPSTSASIDEYETKALSVGPFVRYYKMASEKVGFYGQLAGGYQRLKQESSTTYTGVNPPNGYNSDFKSTGGFASLMPGFVFFPTEKIGLELTVGNLSYYKTKGKPESTSPGQSSYEGTSSSFAADFGLQYITAGISFHLGN